MTYFVGVIGAGSPYTGQFQRVPVVGEQIRGAWEPDKIYDVVSVLHGARPPRVEITVQEARPGHHGEEVAS